MEGLFTDPYLFTRNNENPALQWESAGDFPTTLYDRPTLAFSNLLLRGDVDAATRAIFSPQSLTPAEMKTFTSELLKDKRGKAYPLLKTIVDIVTNPLVIMGAVMSLKFPVKGGTNAIFQIGKGLKDSAPNWMASGFNSGFENLRNIPGMYRALAKWTRMTGNKIVEWSDEFNSIVADFSAKTGRHMTKQEGLQVSAYLQGFHKAEVKGVDIVGGTRHAVQKVHGLMKGQPLWPGLTGQMGPELRSFADKLGGFYKRRWAQFTENPRAFKRFQKTMNVKGQFVTDYFPISPRYGRLEGMGIYGNLRTAKEYGIGLAKTEQHFVSGIFKRRSGVTIGRLEQLREMVKMGMPNWVDDLAASVNRDAVKMEGTIMDAWNAVRRLGTPAQKGERFAVHMMEAMTLSKMNIKARLGSGSVAKEALKQAGHQLSALQSRPEKFASRVREIAEQIMSPAQYDMSPIAATRRYINSAASAYTWHIQDYIPPGMAVPAGRALTGAGQHIMHLSRGAASGWQSDYIHGQLLPLLRGFKPYSAFKRSIGFGSYKANALTWLNTHPLPKKVLDADSMKWLKRYFSDFSSLSSESLGAKMSEFFYVSTLGMNISPASKNLLQNWITTLHMPGITIAGVKAGTSEMAKNVAVFMKSRGTMGTDKAFIKAFPDYVRATGKASGMTKAMLAGGIEKEGLVAPAAANMWQKIKSGMLAPFSASESFNRLFGFYVGKNSHLLSGATLGAAEEFGAMVNHVAHFPGGPLGMPKALLGVWAPARQFMHFPLRYGGFLRSSVDWGTGMSRLTPIAATAGASAGAYIAVKNLLGTDISQGLMMGALPLPQYEKSPFYPWPLVPPLFSLAGTAVAGVAKGEMEDVKRAAALLVPGGLAMRRLYKTLGPKYAAYGSVTEDGRIPVYNEKKALIGAFTPWQLTMKSLGLAPSSQQAEYGAAKWLLTQREKIRDFRRRYLEALAGNNHDKAGRINLDFQKAYPELGPLQIKKSDITAIHNRREISRLHRILKGFPKAYQPLFNQMIGQAGLAEMTADLERQPLSLDLYTPMVQNLQ